jgi:hypothetical protein
MFDFSEAEPRQETNKWNKIQLSVCLVFEYILRYVREVLVLMELFNIFHTTHQICSLKLNFLVCVLELSYFATDSQSVSQSVLTLRPSGTHNQILTVDR